MLSHSVAGTPKAILQLWEGMFPTHRKWQSWKRKSNKELMTWKPCNCISCYIRLEAPCYSSSFYQVSLFAAKIVLQVPQEDSLLPAEWHWVAVLQCHCDVILECLPWIGQLKKTPMRSCSIAYVILEKAHYSTLFFCSLELRKMSLL